MPMDLVAVDTINERIYSFLSVTWAIIADVDIESERYRGLGGARFTVGALARILSKNFTYMKAISGQIVNCFISVHQHRSDKNLS